MKEFVRNNGLSLVFLGLFLLSWGGHAVSGWKHFNDEQQDHGEPAITFGAYLQNPDFLETTFENWESEFLQMAAFVWLSALLYQRGSPESKALQKPNDVDLDPRRNAKPDSPRPVHRGGLALALYSRSLSLTLFALFLVTWALHAIHGKNLYNAERVQHGQAEVTLVGFLKSPQFWFESFQNWQSEFLSVVVLVVLAIFLRQKGSPESKPVHMPHKETEAH